MTDTLTRVGVYGVGHFGYAMLRHLQRKLDSELSLRAYDRDEEVRRCLREKRRHPFHEAPTPVDERVEIVESVAALLERIDALILAVTSDSTREVGARIASVDRAAPLVMINTAKALDSKTGRRLSEISAEPMRAAPFPYIYAALAGGTIASDLLEEEPLGLTVACEKESVLPALKQLFESPSLWVQTTTDLTGVEYASALKSVIAICAGMVRGLGYSHGAVTHLISRMASELERFCVNRLGADRETFSIGSQCWGSDLWMSCMGPTRNRAFGELLGQGLSLDAAERRMAAEHKTVEGVQTLRAIDTLVKEYPEQLPILTVAKRVILDGAPPTQLIDALMRRDAEAPAT